MARPVLRSIHRTARSCELRAVRLPGCCYQGLYDDWPPVNKKSVAARLRPRAPHACAPALRRARFQVGNLTAVLELDRLGVQVISVRESWLDTASPVRPLLLAVFSWVAEQERRRISERTKAGLDRARRHGRHLGRPRVALSVSTALALRHRGLSIRQVARQLKVGASTVHRLLRGHEVEDGVPQTGTSAVGSK